jgi:hypothetical protein
MARQRRSRVREEKELPMFRIPSSTTLCVAVLALVTAAAAQPASAGRLPSSVIHRDRVEAHSSDRYTMTFAGGESAFVTVSGDGDTDLDLFVYDESGHLVASDIDPGDDCVAVFTPRWTGRFTIVIRNHGSVYNRYTLTAN